MKRSVAMGQDNFSKNVTAMLAKYSCLIRSQELVDGLLAKS